MTSRVYSDLAAFAASVVGIPFNSHGRTREDGLDCWGLIVLAKRETEGVDVPGYEEEYEGTGARVCGPVVARHLDTDWKRVESPQPGDVIVFRVGGFDSHVGLLLRERRFLHADRKTGVVIERLNSLLWQRRITGYYRYAGK